MASLFVFFIVLTALTLLNMLIGILTEVLAATSAMQKEQADIDLVLTELATHPIFADGIVTREELYQILDEEELREIFVRLGVDVGHLSQVGEVLFESPVTGEQLDSVTVASLLEFFLHLRDKNTARVVDIADLHKTMARQHAKADKGRQDIKSSLDALDSKIERMSRLLGNQVQTDPVPKSPPRADE